MPNVPLPLRELIQDTERLCHILDRAVCRGRMDSRDAMRIVDHLQEKMKMFANEAELRGRSIGEGEDLSRRAQQRRDMRELQDLAYRFSDAMEEPRPKKKKRLNPPVK